jgi:hypothetical protein
MMIHFTSNLVNNSKYLFLSYWHILGAHSLASITPVVFNTTENVIKRFTPSQRGCYLDKEFQLKILQSYVGYRYSIKNCLYSSVIEKILENCSCIPNVIEYSTENFQQSACRYYKMIFQNLFRLVYRD